MDANLPVRELSLTIERVKNSGIPIGANPTDTALASKLIPLLDDLFIVVANYEELGQIIGQAVRPAIPDEVVEAARQLVSKGVGNVVVIVFEKFLPHDPYVCYANSQDSGFILITDLPGIVNPTGGRDALTAGLIYAMRFGLPLRHAVQIGISAAKISFGSRNTVNPDLTLDKIYDNLVI